MAAVPDPASDTLGVCGASACKSRFAAFAVLAAHFLEHHRVPAHVATFCRDVVHPGPDPQLHFLNLVRFQGEAKCRSHDTSSRNPERWGCRTFGTEKSKRASEGR